MKRRIKASVTVEAAFVVPICLLVFVVLIYVLFYYHDKNILMGIAHETASVGSSREEMTENMLEQYFDEQTNKRLLIFSKIERNIQIEENQVVVSCKATRASMTIQFECKLSKTKPEQYIRNIRKLEKIGEKTKGEGN